MYTLKRDNVVKLTDSPAKRDKYIAEGYKLEVKEQPAPVPEPAPSSEASPAEKPAKAKDKNDK